MRGHAFLADLRYVTDGSVFLQAEAECIAPEIRLVVVRAARVQAEIATDRAHVPQLRTGYGTGRLRQRARVFAHERVERNVGQRFPGADDQLVMRRGNAAQLRNPADA